MHHVTMMKHHTRRIKNTSQNRFNYTFALTGVFSMFTSQRFFINHTSHILFFHFLRNLSIMVGNGPLANGVSQKLKFV